MTITIFGATGKTGQIVTKKALDEGYGVTALVRNPSKMILAHERLTVIKGDALDAEAVKEAVKESQAVISLLGVNPKAGPDVFYRTISHVLAEMRDAGVKRLVMTAGAGVGGREDRVTLMGSLMKGIIKLIAKSAYEDGIKTAALVRETRDMDWSLIRLPMLTDKASTGVTKVGALGRGTGPKISRDDVAAYLLETLKEEKHIREDPVISN